jgi:hypothetical protein
MSVPKKPTLSPDMGWPHISKDPSRGYVEYDPILRIRYPDGKEVKKKGEHGLMDIRAEIARTAYETGMLDNPLIKEILRR